MFNQNNYLYLYFIKTGFGISFFEVLAPVRIIKIKFIKMKEIILEFLEWMPNGIDDIFELMDKPEEVVDKYLKENEK